MAQSSTDRRGRRGLRTHRIASRSTVTGSTSRNLLGFRSRPPARVRRVQRQFGKRIRTLRKSKGLTSEQLARDCRVKTVKMTRIEGGRVDVALSTMVHLSKRLAITLDRLFKGIG